MMHRNNEVELLKSKWRQDMETREEIEQLLDVELLTVLLASAITYPSAVKYFRDVNLLLPNDALCCYNRTESFITM